MSGLHRAGAKIRVRQLRASAARESRGYVKAIAKIAEAVATGDLAPSEAISMAKVVEIYMHALEAKAFDERLAKAADAGWCPETTCRNGAAARRSRARPSSCGERDGEARPHDIDGDLSCGVGQGSQQHSVAGRPTNATCNF